MVSLDARISPVEDSILYFVDRVRTSGAGWVVDRGGDGARAYSSDVPFPLFSVVTGAIVDGEDALEDAARIGGSFVGRRVPWMWWTTPSYTSPGLERALSELGMTAEVAPGMYRALEDVPVESGRFEMVEVPPDHDDFADTLVVGFGLPGFVRDPIKELLGIFTEEEQTILVARKDGRAVGVGTGLISDRTLGIYNFATLPGERGQGIGSQVTAGLLREGARRGCTHAILHTSAMGRPVYENLGFQEVCTTTQWMWFPA